VETTVRQRPQQETLREQDKEQIMRLTGLESEGKGGKKTITFPFGHIETIEKGGSAHGKEDTQKNGKRSGQKNLHSKNFTRDEVKEGAREEGHQKREATY